MTRHTRPMPSAAIERRRTAVTALVIVITCAATSCTIREGQVRWEDVDERRAQREERDAGERERVATAPTPAPPPVAKPAPPPPPTAPPPPPTPTITVRPAAPSAPQTVKGLGTFADGAILDMPALELVCIADARALTDPSVARARFDEVTKKAGVSLGALQFVRMLRDPARSISDPPPRLCRPLTAPAQLKAPLEREREPASRWLIVHIRTSLADDAARGAQLALEKNFSPTATPRVILDDAGRPIGVAVPGAGAS